MNAAPCSLHVFKVYSCSYAVAVTQLRRAVSPQGIASQNITTQTTPAVLPTLEAADRPAAGAHGPGGLILLDSAHRPPMLPLL